MPLKNRRGEYAWQPTSIDKVRLQSDKRNYSTDDTITANVEFRIVGGLRDAFHPDVWTVAWEDFDKILRLYLRASVGVRRGPLIRKTTEIRKQVRRASFYWSRDPDLPYRVWAMIIPEDGGPPQIPTSVENARAKMLDVSKVLKFPTSSLGKGRHNLAANVEARWGRRSFIEKGAVKAKSSPIEITIE